MKHLKKFFEATYSRQELSNNKKFEPALLTSKEYLKAINYYGREHEDNIYNFRLQKISKEELKNKGFNLIKNDKIGKIRLEYYDNKKENEEPNYFNYMIYAYHPDEEVIIGAIQDEWGAVLVWVNHNYTKLGIGETLANLYSKYFPDKDSGGFSQKGYRLYQKLHATFVKKYLEYGIYSEMVRKGEITIERVKEILNSIKHVNLDKKEPNILSKIYGGKGEYMIYLTDSTIIIFDIFLKEAFDNNLIHKIDDMFIKKMIKSYVYYNHLMYGEPEVYNIYDAYANTYNDLKISLKILTSDDLGLTNFFINKNFEGKNKEFLEKIFNDNDFLITDSILSNDKIKIISNKKEPNFQIKKYYMRYSDMWFRKNDNHDEFQNFLLEYVSAINY